MDQNCVFGSAKCVSQTFTVTEVNAIRNYIKVGAQQSQQSTFD